MCGMEAPASGEEPEDSYDQGGTRRFSVMILSV